MAFVINWPIWIVRSESRVLSLCDGCCAACVCASRRIIALRLDRSTLLLLRHRSNVLFRFVRAIIPMCSLLLLRQKETNETFLESLLNACQEWFQERDRLLRSSSQRWVAFINFLNEMYIQVRRWTCQMYSVFFSLVTIVVVFLVETTPTSHDNETESCQWNGSVANHNLAVHTGWMLLCYLETTVFSFTTRSKLFDFTITTVIWIGWWITNLVIYQTNVSWNACFSWWPESAGIWNRKYRPRWLLLWLQFEMPSSKLRGSLLQLNEHFYNWSSYEPPNGSCLLRQSHTITLPHQELSLIRIFISVTDFLMGNEHTFITYLSRFQRWFGQFCCKELSELVPI